MSRVWRGCTRSKPRCVRFRAERRAGCGSAFQDCANGSEVGEQFGAKPWRLWIEREQTYMTALANFPYEVVETSGIAGIHNPLSADLSSEPGWGIVTRILQHATQPRLPPD
jgi:hypothetical protein